LSIRRVYIIIEDENEEISDYSVQLSNKSFVQFLAAGDPNISHNPHGNKFSAISAISAGP